MKEHNSVWQKSEALDGDYGHIRTQKVDYRSNRRVL